MAFVLYDIWTEDDEGHQQLYDATGSLTEAKKMAKAIVAEGTYSVIIYQDNGPNGDEIEIARFEKG